MDVQTIIKRHGFTQQAVADKMVSLRGNAVCKTNFSKTINHGNPTVSYLRQIANIIGANMGEFFEDELPKKDESSTLSLEGMIDVGVIELDGKKYRQLFVPIEDSNE